MYLTLTKVDIKIKRGFSQTYEENKICIKFIKNLKSTEACRVVGIKSNMPLMKKVFMGGIGGIRLSNRSRDT